MAASLKVQEFILTPSNLHLPAAGSCHVGL